MGHDKTPNSGAYLLGELASFQITSPLCRKVKASRPYAHASRMSDATSRIVASTKPGYRRSGRCLTVPVAGSVYLGGYAILAFSSVIRYEGARLVGFRRASSAEGFRREAHWRDTCLSRWDRQRHRREVPVEWYLGGRRYAFDHRSHRSR